MEIRGREIAMIFQEPMTSLNPVLSIGVQLGEGMRRHLGLSRAAAEARAVELLRLVGIGDPERRLKQYPHHLSGGMRQRVMIAVALSCEPKVIIADEPTTALDVTIQAQILELMKDLSRRLGVALVMITHNLGVVARYADRVNVMYAGRIVETGTTARDLHPAGPPLHDRPDGIRAAPRPAALGAPGADRGPAARPRPARRRLLLPGALPLRDRALRAELPAARGDGAGAIAPPAFASTSCMSARDRRRGKFSARSLCLIAAPPVVGWTGGHERGRGQCFAIDSPL